MTEEEKFKNKLDELLESKSFEFDAKNWDKAKAMIDSSRVEQQWFKKYRIMTSIILLLLISSIVYITINSGETEKQNMLSLNSSTKNDNITDTISKTNTLVKELSRDKYLDTNSIEINTQREIKQQEIGFESDEQNKATLTSNLNNTIENKSSLNINRKSEKKEKLQSTKNSNKQNRSYSSQNNTKSSDRIFQNKTQSQFNNENNPKQIDQIIASKNSGMSQAIAADSTIFENKSIREASANSDLGIESQKMEQKFNDVIIPNIVLESYKQQSSNLSEQSYVQAVKINFLTDNNSIFSNEMMQWPLVNIPASSEQWPKQNLFSKHQIGLELGTTFLLGWKDDKGTDAKGFNPIGGVQYIYNFKRRYYLATGIQLTSVGHIQNTDYTAKRIRYNFGEEIDYTTISAQSMYYLVVPVKFLYGIKTNQQIGAGINFAYLLDVSSDVKTYSQKQNSISDPIVTKSNGYKGGFNALDMQMSVVYRRRIFDKLAIHSEFIYGLFDVRNDKYFKPKSFDRNMGLKLTLVYEIFKK
jgi:hypothetical protein